VLPTERGQKRQPRQVGKSIRDERDLHEFEGGGIMFYGFFIIFESEGAFGFLDHRTLGRGRRCKVRFVGLFCVFELLSDEEPVCVLSIVKLFEKLTMTLRLQRSEVTFPCVAVPKRLGMTEIGWH